MRKHICVFAGSSPGADGRYGAAAKALGETIASRGFVLVYGGGRIGVMGALADAAIRSGARVTGVIPRFMVEKDLAHPGVADLRVVDSMHERKGLMAELADAFVALPGGLGTLEEFFEAVEAQQERAVEDDVAQVAAMGLPLEDGLTRADLAINSRYYLALQALLAEENLDAVALRCWPELPDRLGQWPYLAMARLATEGLVVALEGDVDGAVCGLIGRLLGAGVSYLSDWLEHDEGGITFWHPGHAPLDICEPGTARLGRHFNNRLPLVVNALLKLFDS